MKKKKAVYPPPGFRVKMRNAVEQLNRVIREGEEAGLRFEVNIRRQKEHDGILPAPFIEVAAFAEIPDRWTI